MFLLLLFDILSLSQMLKSLGNRRNFEFEPIQVNKNTGVAFDIELIIPSYSCW